MFEFLKLPDVKKLIWGTLLLVVAGLLALLGSVARADGQFYAAVTLSAISLLLLCIVSVLLIPRLVLRLKLDFLAHFQFFRFTSRGAFFVLIVVILAFSSLNTGNNLLILILSTLMASLIVSGVISNIVLHDLQVSLKAPEAIHAGQTAMFLLTLHNMKWLFPSFAVKLKGRGNRTRREKGKTQDEQAEQATDFFLKEKEFPFLRAGERLSLSFSCAFRRRGIYPVEGFEVRTTFPFGFFSRGRNITASGSLVIYPALCEVDGLSRRYPQLQSFLERFSPGHGGSLYNIRNYAPGDSARFVDWKSTAKTARLMVRDFAAEEDLKLDILFSTYLRERNAATLECFEKAVSYVTSLARKLNHAGFEFAVCVGDLDMVIDRGPDSMREFLEYMARVQPADAPDFRAEKVTNRTLVLAAGEQASHLPEVIDYLRW